MRVEGRRTTGYNKHLFVEMRIGRDVYRTILDIKNPVHTMN